jgi:hypothetical protein
LIVAGPFTIQRLPKGLLDFLSMKGSGQTPTELESALRSVIDTTPLYLADRQASLITNTGNIVADGTQAFASTVGTVPNGEVWMPIAASMSRATAGLTAGNTFEIQIQAFVAQFATVVFPGIGNVVTPNGGHVGVLFPNTFLMQPGDRFSAITSKGAYAGTNALVFNLWYHRLFI